MCGLKRYNSCEIYKNWCGMSHCRMKFMIDLCGNSTMMVVAQYSLVIIRKQVIFLFHWWIIIDFGVWDNYG